MDASPAKTTRLTQEQLDEIVGRLVAALSPLRIYLFGSHVYGVPGPDSDIDLLILVADSELPADDQDTCGYRALRGMFLPIELHVRGEREFAERAAVPTSFEKEVQKKGRLLYAA